MEDHVNTTLPPGKRLGHFEIVEAIGAGGMGQVYRARDTRLGRDVAIKILPPALASSPGFRERFEREARTISSLNHPHICTLHDVGRDEGLDYLVMEYLKGASLAERLQQGPIAVAELLSLAVQVADALDRAHRAGLVHRDLKPGNIMVTQAGAKLLDFGVAKSTVSGGPAGDLTSSPTLTSPLTAAGAIVGTFQYMAPELFEGMEADARSDIFAFGTVLYEMATGKRAFDGNTQAMVIASILKEAPRPLPELAPAVPRGLERLIDSCLVKNPEKRRQSVHDLKLELQSLADDTAGTTGVARAATGASPAVMAAPRTGNRSPWLVTTLLLAAALAALGAWTLLRPAVPGRLIYASIPPPEGWAYVVAGMPTGSAVLSPDGSRIAFTARQAGKYQIWMRRLDALEAVPLPGTDHGRRLFWSPDSRFIGFFAGSKLKKIAADGGPAVILADAPDGRGGSWNEDGVILFSPNYLGPIHRIPAGGGTPMPVTRGDDAAVFTHRYPTFLPDGDHFLYLKRGTTSGAGDRPSVEAGSLSGGPGETRTILDLASNVAYADGSLLYVQDGTLLAVPFDPAALAIRGDPVVVASDVVSDLGFSHAAFSVSRTGSLVFHTGQAYLESQLTWFDRQGNELGMVGEPATCDSISLSPDGSKLAASCTNMETGKGDIWVHGLEHGTRSRLSFDDGDDQGTVWTPDGTEVTFASARSRGFEPYIKLADGSGAGEALFEAEGDVYPLSWTPDRQTLVFVSATSGGQATLAMATGGKITPLWEAPSDFLVAELSRDGKWLAYVLQESGRGEIFVSPFPDGGTRRQVSTGGGGEPRWRDDGKELFYRATDGMLMVAAISVAGSKTAVGPSRPLFRTSAESVYWAYDVTADGQRFIVNTLRSEKQTQPLTLVLNWRAKLGP